MLLYIRLMKIFFISDRKDLKHKTECETIISTLSANGNQVDRSHFNRTSEQDSNNFEKAYKDNLKSIKECEVLVAEVTNLSSGIGFLISTAMGQKKPVLALFNKNSDNKPSTTLRGSTNRLMNFKYYTSANLQDVIKEFLVKVKKELDTKFILIISPEIDRYLEWASEFRRMHKAQVVRESVEAVIKKDKEYKSLLG